MKNRTDIRATGCLIINADDWGRDIATTNRSLACITRRCISSVSAMVFMQDSERAAELARNHTIDAGLHLNLTTPFSGSGLRAELLHHHEAVSHYLTKARYSQSIFHPGLANSFHYCVSAQLEEFTRLYGDEPLRMDGHHHMHLAANVVLGHLIPDGVVVRRNFTFGPGEKSFANRLYRRVNDALLARRHPMTDFFFSLQPIAPASRLKQLFSLAHHSVVEVESHPVNDDEYQLLTGDGRRLLLGDVTISDGYIVRKTFDSSVQHATTMGETHSRIHRKERSVTNHNSVASSFTSDRNMCRINMQPHITVCICTYKRPGLLDSLLRHLSQQRTGDLFTYSIVISDNDIDQSGRAIAEAAREQYGLSIVYCVEPHQNIALARNAAVTHASGDFLAFIDDDEFPISDWLLCLFITLNGYAVDGVLGPVKRYFDRTPPRWLEKSTFYVRPILPTGTPVEWQESRSGNVLLKREIVAEDPMPFRPQFRAGEDNDFFRRQIQAGRRFIWCDDADVFELVPPARWSRRYLMKKALLRGATAALQADMKSIAKSIIAVPVYVITLPIALFGGQTLVMTQLVKLCDHIGKLLVIAGINPIREPYISDHASEPPSNGLTSSDQRGHDTYHAPNAFSKHTQSSEDSL